MKKLKALLFASAIAAVLTFAGLGITALKPAAAADGPIVPFKAIAGGTEYPQYGSGIRYSQPIGAHSKNSILWPTLLAQRDIVVRQSPDASIDLSDSANLGMDYTDAALTFWFGVQDAGALANMQRWKPDTGNAFISLSDLPDAWTAAHDTNSLFISLVPYLADFQVGWNKVSAKLNLAIVKSQTLDDYLTNVQNLRFVLQGSDDTYNYAISDVHFRAAAGQTDAVKIIDHEVMTEYLSAGHVSEVVLPTGTENFPGATAVHADGGPNDAPYVLFAPNYQTTAFEIEIDNTGAADFSFPAISLWVYISNIASFQGVGDSQLEFRTVPFSTNLTDAQGEAQGEVNIPLSVYKSQLQQGWNRVLIPMSGGYGGPVRDIFEVAPYWGDPNYNQFDWNKINYFRLYAVGGSGYSGQFGLSDIRIVETTYIDVGAVPRIVDFIPVPNVLTARAYVGKDTALRGLVGTGLTFTSSDPNIVTVNSSGVLRGVAAGTATVTANNTMTGDYNTVTVTVTNATAESAVLVNEKAENTYSHWPGIMDVGPERTPENGRKSLSVFKHSAGHAENWFSLNGNTPALSGATGGVNISGVPNPALNFLLYVSKPDAVKTIPMDIAIASGVRRVGVDAGFDIGTVDGFTRFEISPSSLGGLQKGWNEFTVPLADAIRNNADLTNITSVVFRFVGNNDGSDFYVYNVKVVESDVFAFAFRPFAIYSTARAYVGKDTTLRGLSGTGLTYTSQDPSKVTIDAVSGVMHGVAAGTTTITANNTVFGDYNTVTVTVTDVSGTNAVLANEKAEQANVYWRQPELFAPGWTAANQYKSFPLLVHGGATSTQIENWINLKGSDRSTTDGTGGVDISGVYNPILKFDLYIANAAQMNSATLNVGFNSGARRAGTPDIDFDNACTALWSADTNFTKFAITGTLTNGWNEITLPQTYATVDNADYGNITCVVFRFNGANGGQLPFVHNLRVVAGATGAEMPSISSKQAAVAAPGSGAWDSDPSHTFTWKNSASVQFLNKSVLNTPASMDAAYTKFALVNGSADHVDFDVDFNLSGIAEHNVSRLALEIWIYLTSGAITTGNAGGEVFGFALYNADSSHGILTNGTYGAAGIYNWMGFAVDDVADRTLTAGWNRVRIALGSSGFMENVVLSAVNLLRFDPRINKAPVTYILSNPRIVYQGDTDSAYQDSFINMWAAPQRVPAPAALTGIGLAAPTGAYTVPSNTVYDGLAKTGLTAGAGVFVYSSENPLLVAVDPWSGEMSFIGEGTAAIRLTLLGTELFVSQNVTGVGPALTGAGIDKSGFGAHGTWNAETNTLTLTKADSFTLTYTLIEADALNVVVTWATSGADIVNINPNTGALILRGNGTVTITMTAVKGETSFSDTVKLTVNSFVVLEGITIDNVALTNKEPFIVEYTLTGQNVPATAGVTYSSDKPEIVTVDENGDLVAVANGTATVTATVTLNGVTKTTTFTVTVSGLQSGSGNCRNSAALYAVFPLLLAAAFLFKKRG